MNCHANYFDSNKNCLTKNRNKLQLFFVVVGLKFNE